MWEKASDKEKEKYALLIFKIVLVLIFLFSRYEQMAKEDKERYAKELNFSTTFQIFRMEQKVESGVFFFFGFCLCACF